jgi:hypothetical protein
VKGIHFFEIKGQVLFKGEIIRKNVKMGWGHLKIFFPRTTGPILTKLGTSHPSGEGFKIVQLKGIASRQREIIVKE